MLPYEYARLIVQAEKVSTKQEYGQFVQLHEADTPLPKDPSQFYEQWQGWSGFLGKSCDEDFFALYREALLAQLAASGIERYRKTKRGAGFLV